MISKGTKGTTAKSQPWQVKGVTPETREAVKRAARKSGMAIGTWTNEVLHRAAVDDLTGRDTLPAHRVEDQLAEISAKLDQMHQPWWKRLFDQDEAKR